MRNVKKRLGERLSGITHTLGGGNGQEDQEFWVKCWEIAYERVEVPVFKIPPIF